MLQYVEEQRCQGPVLIYAVDEYQDSKEVRRSLTLKSEEEQKQERVNMLQYFGNYRQATDLSNYSLKHLEEEKGKTGQHPVLLLNQTSIRGFDFETSQGGGYMVLVIVSVFPTERDRKQCIGRVGRYGRPCKRIQKAGIDDFQYDVQSAINTEIHKVIRAENEEEASLGDLACFVSSESSRNKEQQEEASNAEPEGKPQKVVNKVKK